MGAAETEVLIVGAGPCGLMLANELGRRGIDVIVVDRESGVATAPQANATQARTMEHYRRLGFAHEVRRLGLPGDYPTDVAYFTTFAGYELARHRMPCSNDAAAFVREHDHVWNGAELPHRIPQSLIEKTLWEKAQALETVKVEFDWTMQGFDDDGTHVVTHLAHTQSGVKRLIRAQYLFAADGSQSTARKQLGISYSGEDPARRDFMGGRMLSVYLDAPAFYEEVPAPRAWMYWTFNRRRRALLASVDGRGRLVLQTQLRDGEYAEKMTKEDAGKLFIQAVGKEIPFEVTGIASWLAGRALVADRFSVGRVFLGGDAVHLFTPTGGMGYNTAIEDAVNIGWKLAAVLRGQASASLLDSYSAERRPVAVRNTRFAIAFADSIGLFTPSQAIESDDDAGRAARRRAGAYLQQHGQKEFTIPGFTFGARYDGSPVIFGDGSPMPPDAPSVYVPSAKPGGRAPHLWMADGGSLFDRFNFEWTLLSLVSDAEAETAFKAEASRRGISLAVLDLSAEPVARDLYETPFALIRPDQIVAWRGGAVGTAEVARILNVVTGGAPASGDRQSVDQAETDEAQRSRVRA